MNMEILKLLNKNARMTAEDIAAVTGLGVNEVKNEITSLEKEGWIRGYKAVIDWEKSESPYISAIIELKVTPKVGFGFEKVAECVARYPQVESVYLMSGTYDLSVVVKCKTFQEVSLFVAKELSTVESVTATATHFVMRRYKELDIPLCIDEEDERGNYLL